MLCDTDRSSRLYTIHTENGTDISRNHIDLKCTDVPSEAQPHPVPVVSQIAKSLHAPSNSPNNNTNVKHGDKAKLIRERVMV